MLVKLLLSIFSTFVMFVIVLLSIWTQPKNNFNALSAKRQNLDLKLHHVQEHKNFAKNNEKNCKSQKLENINSSNIQNFKDPFVGGGMTLNEQRLLAGVLQQATSVFEWGMGSSTLLAMFMNVTRLTSFDSSLDWVKKVKKNTKTSQFNTSFSILHANIGPIKSFGRPLNNDFIKLWPSYSKQVDKYPKPFDLYIIDGRFRVACGCRAILYSHCNSLFAFHDFNRKEYSEVLKIMHKLSQVHNLAILRKKMNVSKQKVYDIWEHFKYIEA